MRVTILSNGHGEDAVGVLLAKALLDASPNLELQAFPTVGRGRAYEALELPILGPRLELPSGGWMMHTASGFWNDLRAGFVPMTASQLRELRRLETDVLLVVGDIYALLLGTLVRTRKRFYMQTLVSAYLKPTGQKKNQGQARPNRYFMERISAPERFLVRRAVLHTYVRDEVTATLLHRYGLLVSALGNPMLDALEPDELALPLTPPVVALLPGTRLYREAALAIMLEALGLWPAATALIAWTGEVPPQLEGWTWQPEGPDIWEGSGPGGPRGRVYLLTRRFAGVLHASQLVLGTAGTANEQAASLGLPLVSFPVPPLYTDAFLRNQERLLGAALSLCPRDPQALAQTLRTLWADRSRYRLAAQTGTARMGRGGGSAAIARDMLARSAHQPRVH